MFHNGLHYVQLINYNFAKVDFTAVLLNLTGLLINIPSECISMIYV